MNELTPGQVKQHAMLPVINIKGTNQSGDFGQEFDDRFRTDAALLAALATIAESAPQIVKAFSTSRQDQRFIVAFGTLWPENVAAAWASTEKEVLTKKETIKKEGLRMATYRDIDQMLERTNYERGTTGFIVRQIASTKSRGFNTALCVDVIKNALSIPTEEIQRMVMIEYAYVLELNKVANFLYPDFGNLATPGDMHNMLPKLNEHGRSCLKQNPHMVKGEPRFSAACYRPGVLEPGTDGRNYISTKHGTWQFIDKGHGYGGQKAVNFLKRDRRDLNTVTLGDSRVLPEGDIGLAKVESLLHGMV